MRKKPILPKTLKAALVQIKKLRYDLDNVRALREEQAGELIRAEQRVLTLQEKNKQLWEQLPNQTTHLRALATIRRDLSKIDEQFVKMNIPLVAQELDI